MKFEFKNLGFNLTEQVIDNIYIKIWRQMRVDPYPGMKQPTPFGGFLGFEIKLMVKCDGLLTNDHGFKLYKDDQLIQDGELTNGIFSGLNIHHESTITDYSIEIFEINKESEVCNTLEDHLPLDRNKHDEL